MRFVLCLAGLVLLAVPAAAAPTPLSFVWPTSVEVEPGGSLLVVESGLHRLLRINARRRVKQLATLTKPYAVERSPSGRIYVTDGPVLRRIDGKGTPVKVAEAVGDIGPIAIARNGDLYFPTEAALWKLRGGSGPPVRVAAGTKVSAPHGLAVAPDGTLLVCDTGKSRILRVDPRDGKATLFAHLAVPHGMDVGADGSVYVADGSSNRVVHLSASGKRLGFVGPLFDDPYNVRLAPGGALYVV